MKNMLTLRKAFKFELRTTPALRSTLMQIAGSCRFVFNKALALQQVNHADGQKFITYNQMAKNLTQWRRDEPTIWLRDSPVHPLQQALKDLDRAYTNFFAKRARFPRFRKKGLASSFRYPDPKQFKLDQANHRIFLPKIGWVRYRGSREVIGDLRNVTVSNRSGKWFISIQVEMSLAEPVHASKSMVGVDLGVANFATLSNGIFYAPTDALKRHEQRLARYQRAMARKQKGSQNRARARVKVQRVYAKIANSRQDYLHKLSTTISKNHAVVVMEDLQVRNMTGSRERIHTDNNRRSRHLNRSILDQGWYQFRVMMDYKMQERGGQLIIVNPRNTSRTCPACGHISAGNRLSQSEFRCEGCGHTAHADVNAAINIAAAGHAVLACGVRGLNNNAAKAAQASTGSVSHEVGSFLLYAVLTEAGTHRRIQTPV